MLESSHGISKKLCYHQQATFFFLCCCCFFYHWPPSTFPVTTHKHTHTHIVSQGGTLQSTSALLQLLCPVSTVAFSAGQAIPRAFLNKLASLPGSRRKCNSIRETTQSDGKIFHPWWPREPLAVTHVASLALSGMLRLDYEVSLSSCTLHLPHLESMPFSRPIILICE